MDKKQKPSTVKRIAAAVFAAALAAAVTGCDAATDIGNVSNGSEATSSANSVISDSSTEIGQPEIKEVHFSDDLKFLIEATDEEILKRCEDTQSELYKNNFIASDGRSYRIAFDSPVGIPMGLSAPIEMLLPEKSFYTFGELYDILDGDLKIYYLEAYHVMTDGGLLIYTEIDEKQVYFLVEPDNYDNSRGDYVLPFNTEVNFKGIVISGTYVTDHREYM